MTSEQKGQKRLPIVPELLTIVLLPAWLSAVPRL